MEQVEAYRAKDGTPHSTVLDALTHESAEQWKEHITEFFGSDFCPYKGGSQQTLLHNAIVAWELFKSSRGGALSPTGITKDTLIGGLDITIRTQTWLKAEGVNTVGDLLQLGKNNLLKKQNIGRKTLNEVMGAMGQHGLRLSEEGAGRG